MVTMYIQEGMTHTHPHTHSNVNNHTPPLLPLPPVLLVHTITYYTAAIHPHKPFITSYDIMSHHYYTS